MSRDGKAHNAHDRTCDVGEFLHAACSNRSFSFQTPVRDACGQCRGPLQRTMDSAKIVIEYEEGEHRRHSERITKLVRVHFDVSEDLAQQPGPNVAAFVNRHRCAAAVGMRELPMAALRFANEDETHPFQRANKLARLEEGKVRHTVTSTRRTLMISGCVGTGFPCALSSSRQSAITSLMFSRTSS